MPALLTDLRADMARFSPEPRLTKNYPELKIRKGTLEVIPAPGLGAVTYRAVVEGETDDYLSIIQFFDVDFVQERDDTHPHMVDYQGENIYYSTPSISSNPVMLKCGCFTGSTLIPLADGKSVPIKDLVGQKEFFVYSFDEKTKAFVIGKGYNCKVTRKNTEILELVFDNGNVVSCTPDHEFLTKGGQWIQAQNLTPEMSLNAMYRRLSDGSDNLNRVGYEMVLQRDDWQYTHYLADSYNTSAGVYEKSAGNAIRGKFNLDELIKEATNHKVVEVRRTSRLEDGAPCSSGVVVHNCPDFRFRAEKELYDTNALIGKWRPYTRKTPRPETGKPGARPYANPTHVPMFCKHIYALLSALNRISRVRN
jgi:hypothetical protein